MFAGRFSSSIGPVGIDYGTHGVRMLQLREQGGRLHVVGASRLDAPLTAVPAPKKDKVADGAAPAAEPDPDSRAGEQQASAQAQQFRAAFAAGGFTGRKCVVSLPRQDVSLQSVRLPRMPDEELRQTALWESSQRFGLDRNAMQVDFIRTGAAGGSGGAENKEEVILIAASHAAINARLEPLLAAGLRPVAVDTGFAALARAFSRQTRREADRNVVRAVVEIGSAGACVFILRGDQIAFCKPISIGGRQLNQAVAEHLQIDEKSASELRAARIAASLIEGAESDGATDSSTDRAVYEAVRPLLGEIVKEVTLCLRYYGVTFRGHPPERVILTGGDGLEPRLAETMNHACKIPVAVDDGMNTLGSLIPQIGASLNRKPGPAACWAVCVGLSLRGLQSRRSRKEAPVAAQKEAA